MPHPRPDDTTHVDAIDRDSVLMASNAHHGPACSLERVPCPLHGAPLGEHYMPAEVHRRAGGTFIFAHDCHGSWRLIEAMAA